MVLSKAIIVITISAGLIPAGLLAQSSQGGVRGAVTDTQNGAIADVKVSLVNGATGETRAALTNASGGFDFTAVVPATYSIVAEHPGFKRFERKNVVIDTQELVTVDVKLEIGSVSDSVMVTEEVPLVEASNASQGQVLDNQKLIDLPNLGRNPFMLSKLSANVIPVGNPAYNRMEDQSGSSAISIAGGPVRGNNYLLDGVPITDANNRAIIIPSLEAVQEVKVQANTYDAEMARTGGGMFNTLMKSGTNDPTTAALYGHLRPNFAWDANSYLQQFAAGIADYANQPNDTWGASFGGPNLDSQGITTAKTRFVLSGSAARRHYDDTQSASSHCVQHADRARARREFLRKVPCITIYNPNAAMSV